MKAVFLVKNGAATTAFEMRETPTPVPTSTQVLIKVTAFGLNFADVMARHGMYKEAPPKPCVLGYDVAGVVISVGASVQNVKPGDEVTAMTRFGGYAEFAVTESSAVAIIPPGINHATATTLTTQYCTAYYAAIMQVNLREGDKVLVHAGAGGVGMALVQLALHKKCIVFSTAGSEKKLDFLKNLGVQFPINYVTTDFSKKIKKVMGDTGVDVIFDAVGGASVRKGFNLLGPGGRLVCYGASQMTGKNLPGKLAAAIGFGIYHPVMFMMASKSIIGINMLHIADHKPGIIQECLQGVVDLTTKGILQPYPATEFPVTEIAAAHEALEKRKSMGKVAVTW
ncbi:MAG: zinc-binding dehydrogenase [Ferruginibacter sp.]|nr:zinc-binding dehydrogenase [Ferruginibacter sp.]